MKRYTSKEFELSMTVLKVCRRTLLIDMRATTERQLLVCYKLGTNLGISYIKKSHFAMLYKAYNFKPVN